MKKDLTVFFEHGQVVKVKPEPRCDYGEYRHEINEATLIVSDGIPYDLTSVESINSIATPQYVDVHKNKNANSLGVTGYLEYVLRMHSGWTDGNIDLEIACLEKATTLMPHSSIAWTEKDYLKIVYRLEELGRFDEVDYWEKWIDENSPSLEDTRLSNFHRTLQLAKQFKTDLVAVNWAGAQSAVVAKYQGRVYSISGEDKRFPYLPDFIKETGRPSCNPILYENIKNMTIYYKGREVPIEKLTWRPFIDDRSDEEKAAYLKSKEKAEQDQEYRIARRVYYQLKFLIPEYVPKSMAAFTRMKNAKNEKYQELVKKAEEAGFIFPEMTVEIQEPIDPEPDYNGKQDRGTLQENIEVEPSTFSKIKRFFMFR